MSGRTAWGARVAWGAGALAVWALAAAVGQSPLFPGPLEVARSAVQAAASGTLGLAVLTSILRLLFGYAVALLIGVPLGGLLARSSAVKTALGPLVLGLGAVPSICWLPLAILWFGLSEKAIQVVIVLGALLPVATATEAAVRHVDPRFERAARTMGATGTRLLFEVTLPAALPGILAGAKIGWTFALRSLMAGELLFVSGGLGQILETGRDLGDTPLVLAVVVVVVVMSRLSEALIFSPLDREIARRWGTEAV